MSNVFTVEKIVQEFGKFYQDGGQGQKDFFRGLMQPSVTLKMAGMRQIRTKDTLWRLANPIIGSFMQPFQKGFTPKGSIDWHPNVITMQKCKIDVEIDPEEIEESYLGFLGGLDSSQLDKWPIVHYIRKNILDAVEQDKELYCAYSGVHEDPVTGTAGEAYQCFDGLKKQLVDGAKSDYPVHIIEGIGELTTEDVFDQIEEFYAKLPERYRRAGMPIFVSDDMLLAYQRIKRDRGYYNVQDDGGISTRVDFSRANVISLPSMAGTKDIFSTIPSNIAHLTKRDLGGNNFDVQKADRIVKLLLDWYEGLGFCCNDYVYTNRATVADACVADPVISQSGNSITMSCATSGATIKYTTDGSEPTADSTSYSSAITIEADTTFVAKAFKTGLVDSTTVVKTAEFVTI